MSENQRFSIVFKEHWLNMGYGNCKDKLINCEDKENKFSVWKLKTKKEKTFYHSLSKFCDLICKGRFRNTTTSKMGLLETIVNRKQLPTVNFFCK